MNKGVIIAGAGRGMVFAKLIAAANPASRELTAQNCVDWIQLAATTETRQIDRSVVGIVEIREEIHARVRAELDEAGLTGTRIFTTLEAALTAVPVEEADAVMVVTPNATHAELTELALKHGRHVFLEKPIASAWSDVRRIARAAKKHQDRIVLLGFVLRYSNFYQRLKEICDSGVIGRLVMIQANERLDLDHSSSYRRGWRRKQAATGGSLNEKCSHDLDILCWLKAREAKVEAVFSAGGQELFRRDEALPERCPDCTDRNCPFRLTPEKLRNAKGSFKRDLGQYDRCIYRTDADVNTEQSVTLLFDDRTQAVFTMLMYSGRPGRDIVIHGTSGMLTGCFESGKIEFINYRTGETIDRSIQLAEWHGGGDALVLNDFFDSIDRQGIPVSRLEDGIAATRIALAADLSCRDRRLVPLAELKI